MSVSIILIYTNISLLIHYFKPKGEVISSQMICDNRQNNHNTHHVSLSPEAVVYTVNDFKTVWREQEGN